MSGEPSPPPGLSVVVVRRGGRPAWQAHLSPVLMWVAGILLLGVVVAAVVAAVTYVQSMERIEELSALTEELETLRQQNRAVQELEAELRELRELQQQMLQLAGIESALGVDDRMDEGLPGEEGAGLLLWPIDGEAVRSLEEGHPGVDLSAAWKQTIVAAGDGTVIEEGRSDVWGHRLVIDHGDSLRTVYANNEMNLVTVGDRVEAGQVVALVGRGPEGKTPHLHFEVWKGERPVPPRDLIPDLFPQH